MNRPADWILLVTTLPARRTAARMRLWRGIRSLGAASLRDGVYLLPGRADTAAALRGLGDDVCGAGGDAELLQIVADPAQDASFRRRFDRAGDYATLIEAIRQGAEADGERALRRLSRQFEAVAATDYFGGDAREQARQALADLAARLSPDEPRPLPGAIRRRAAADFQGRRWATRRHPRVDRLGSAWLIGRFIDRQARFLWLDSPADCPADALGFDFDGASFSHVDGPPERVTFEVLALSFGLDGDPAIARIAAIVHCLDVGGAPVAEAAGVAAILAGLGAATDDDDRLLADAGRLFDSLYRSFRRAPDDA